MTPVLLGVHDQRRHDLLLIGSALDGIGGFLGLAEHRQQHGDQQGDDGDHHQQLHQSKARQATTRRIAYAHCAPFA